MTKEKIIEKLRAEHKRYKALIKEDFSYYTGITRGIEMSLELIGMLDNKQNK